MENKQPSTTFSPAHDEQQTPSKPLKTNPCTRQAIKRYESKLIKKNIHFNPKKPFDAQILSCLEQDGRPFATIVRCGLSKEFNLEN